jgi:hypothetical protein
MTVQVFDEPFGVGRQGREASDAYGEAAGSPTVGERNNLDGH